FTPFAKDLSNESRSSERRRQAQSASISPAAAGSSDDDIARPDFSVRPAAQPCVLDRTRTDPGIRRLLSVCSISAWTIVFSYAAGSAVGRAWSLFAHSQPNVC